MILIRKAEDSDQEAIMGIYNEAVENTTATFDTELRSFEKQLSWFKAHKKNHPVLVAEKEKQVVGWASLSPWSDRCAYDATVEISVYVHHAYRSSGIGSQLMKAVIEEGRLQKNHTVISRITEGNEASIKLHEKLGFQHIGTMKEVGFKFGKFLDVQLMQLMY
jgi:phosphinothricin acetyltransferase